MNLRHGESHARRLTSKAGAWRADSTNGQLSLITPAQKGDTTMAKIDFNKIPRFSQLPIKPGAPPDSNWGVFGEDDEVGCINFLTEDGIIEAAKLVRKGKVFRLDTPVNYAT